MKKETNFLARQKTGSLKPNLGKLASKTELQTVVANNKEQKTYKMKEISNVGLVAYFFYGVTFFILNI